MTFSRGKYAKAICDICGLDCKYLELEPVIRDSHDTGLKSCKRCNDPDHPQNKVDELVINDAISLEDPHPDNYDSTATLTPALSTLFLDQ